MRPERELNIESPIEIKSFSDEQKEALWKLEFIILDLTGESIKSLRDKGFLFSTDWHKRFTGFEALASMHSEAAINPDKLFLPNTTFKTPTQQKEMVRKFSNELGKKVRGVKAIIGSVPDYAELYYKYHEATNEYLFGTKGDYSFALTQSPAPGYPDAYVGRLREDDRLVIGRWFKGSLLAHAAPLVVPV